MPDLSFDQTCEGVGLIATAAVSSRDLALTEVLPDVLLDAMVAGTRQLVLSQTLEPVLLEAHSIKGRSINVSFGTAEARLSSHVALGEPPPPMERPGFAKLYNLTGRVRGTGGAIICFVGPPWKTIQWRLLKGHGVLMPFTTFSDGLGRCSCRYDAGGFVGSVVIGAAYVP